MKGTRTAAGGDFKHTLFDQFARIGKALSHANRLELLEFLAQGERSVDALAKVSGMSVANTSQHLQQLRQAGLVTTRREGKTVNYRVSDADILDLVDRLRRVAERHLAEVEQLVNRYLTVKDDFEPLPAAELLSRAQAGLVTVIDVRPLEEFHAGHLPGAINVPLNELEKRLREFDQDKEVIAYCRGPYCVLAFEAVARLRRQGLPARRLEDGFPEWQLAGHPVEKPT